METPNYRKASIYFDDETVLEVEQRGGGGSGVGGETGLAAVNLKTGESTNAALAEKDETIEQQAETIETQAGTIEEQAATIETQAGTISDLEDEVAAKQAIIDAFPTIEALNVTANGTYNEDGKAYKPVTVNVPSVAIKNLQINYSVNLNLSDYPAVLPLGSIVPPDFQIMKLFNSASNATSYVSITSAVRSIRYLLPSAYKFSDFRATTRLTNAGGNVTLSSDGSLAIINLPEGVFDVLPDYADIAICTIVSA